MGLITDLITDELTVDEFAALVRFNGANVVLDALLVVAAEAYGEEAAVVNLHRLFLDRSARLFAKDI